MGLVKYCIVPVALVLPYAQTFAGDGWVLKMNGLSPDASFQSVAVPDENTIWVFGGSVYRSTDLGDNWIHANAPDSSEAVPYPSYGPIAAWDSLNAVVATTGGFIYRTSNGGTTWKKVFDNPTVTTFFNHLEMLNATDGYAVGDAPNASSPPTFVKTTDSGWTWNPASHNLPLGCAQYVGPTTDFINPEMGWSIQLVPTTPAASSFRCTLFKTVDGGATWTKLDSTHGAYSVSFADELHGFLTSGHREPGVHRSVDGGNTWEYVLAFNPLAFVGCSPAGDRIWTGGGTGEVHDTVYASDDGGDTWYTQYVPTPSGGSIGNYSFLSSNIGALVGYKTIAVTVSGGNPAVTTAGVGGNAPESYFLSQNYPNPFNLSTRIEYSLPEASWVRISVYSVLGDALLTLVEGEQAAGAHTVEFNASNLASGVYFYRLQAKDYTSTRPAMLLK